MAYNRISNQNTKQATKKIDTSILGRYMADGTVHICKVTGVEVRAIGNADTVNSFMLTLENTFGETHRQNVFMWDSDDGGLSPILKSLISTAVKHPAEVQRIATDLEDFDWTILDTLVGANIQVELARSKGYRTLNTVGGLEATDSTGKAIGKYQSLKELKDDMKSRGMKRSVTYVYKFSRIGRKDVTATKTCEKSTKGTNSTKPVGTKRTGQVPTSRKMW